LFNFILKGAQIVLTVIVISEAKVFVELFKVQIFIVSFEIVISGVSI
jgi:hypothetical protein